MPNGKKHFQPKCINWSYLYLGKVARVTIKNSAPRRTFNENQKLPGIYDKGTIFIMGSQPPKNNIEDNADISNKKH